MVSVIFIRKSIPSSTKLFVSLIFNHSTTEFWISCESVMDSLEILFLASFLQLVSRKVFFVSRLLTTSMSMRSSLLDDILWDWKKVHRIFWRIFDWPPFLFCKKCPQCAIDDAQVPIWKTCCALRFGFRLEQFTQFDATHILNHFLWFLD